MVLGVKEYINEVRDERGPVGFPLILVTCPPEVQDFFKL